MTQLKKVLLLNGSNRLLMHCLLLKTTRRDLKQATQKFQLLLHQFWGVIIIHLQSEVQLICFLLWPCLSATWKICLPGSNFSCLVSKRVKRTELLKLLSSLCYFLHLQAISRDRGQHFLETQPKWWSFLSHSSAILSTPHLTWRNLRGSFIFGFSRLVAVLF